MGINKMEGLIDAAIADGFLVQASGNARTLSATDKPTEIPIARLPKVDHVHGAA